MVLKSVKSYDNLKLVHLLPSCDAVFTFVEKDTSKGNPNTLIQIKVRKNNQRTLASQFKGYFFEVRFSTGGHDCMPNLGTPGETKFPDLMVIRYGLKKVSTF